MATTRTYLDYLDEKIDISPANSQEELDAAELMGSLMEEHGLDVQTQEFDAPAQGKLAHYVLYIVMFVGISCCLPWSLPAVTCWATLVPAVAART